MKIGLWSDSINFPSLPLMKISAYHKARGDNVEFIKPFGEYDKVYLSKVFNLPLIKKIPKEPPEFYADEIHKGGTGFAIDTEDGREVFKAERHSDLPEEAENIYPDYSLYPQYTEAYGFLTRGCPNNCSFCLVSKKEGVCSRRVAELKDFCRGQRVIKLLDPNLLACRERADLLKELKEAKAAVDFTQGLDARFVDDDIARLICSLDIKTVHFAFDLMENEREIVRGLSIFKKYYDGDERNIKCYVLTNNDTSLQEDWYRVRKLCEMGYTPYVMIYRKGTHPRFLTDLARWCNNLRLKRSVAFEDYIPRVDGKTCGELYKDIIN